MRPLALHFYRSVSELARPKSLLAVLYSADSIPLCVL